MALPAHAFLARPTLFAAIGAATKAPSGWQQFCAENAEDCRPGADQARDVVLTPELLQQLYETNKYVNDRVAWTSDDALYGKAERWTLPLDRGDCEDIVLLKRKMLAKLGWPQGSLLITTVEEPGPAKGRHAVLTVRSDRGEMILDNQTPEILFWYETQIPLPVAAKRHRPERLGGLRRRAAQAAGFSRRALIPRRATLKTSLSATARRAVAGHARQSA
ncbi:putative transglutaminase-like cysteine proteinase [Bradyrhizobium sp. i1.3.1]